MNATLVPTWRVVQFHGLPKFSRRQAAAWNTLLRMFSGGPGWEAWVADGVGEFFESPAGFEIQLRQQNATDPQGRDASFTFDARDLTLGRDETCQVQLAPRSVAKHHARIFTRAGKCYLEDLGSSVGTFLNEIRLAPHTPAPIATGDQFAIFPYTFAVELTERWVRTERAYVRAGVVLPLNWQAFRETATADCTLLTLEVQPINAALVLESGRQFLERLSAKLLAPFGQAEAARLGFTPAGVGFVELLAASVLERVNREISFPLQVAIAGSRSAPAFDEDQSGLSFSFAIRVADLTGAFRLFLPNETVEMLGRAASPQMSATPAAASWMFRLSAGYVDLSATEAAALEQSDIVLLKSEVALLFPGAPERGWKLISERGNFSHAAIEKYFESGSLSESQEEREPMMHPGAAPDFASLPIRLHAIVGEKELTLAEANLLVAGTILELDRIKTDPVRIALNGKILGEGELVEIDGRLGVRILAWRAP